MEMTLDRMLKLVNVVRVGMPVDNLAVDKDGDIFAAGFPSAQRFLETYSDPFNIDSPTTIWRIRRRDDEYVVTKVLEDKEARTFGGATVARHDVTSGKIFIGGKVLGGKRTGMWQADGF